LLKEIVNFLKEIVEFLKEIIAFLKEINYFLKENIDFNTHPTVSQQSDNSHNSQTTVTNPG